MSLFPDLSLCLYRPFLKKEWDDFVRKSKNGTFLFCRDYMDYHADRFPDSSLMVYKRGNPVALFPASRSGQTLGSHPGLTYGGFITSSSMTADEMLEIFSIVKRWALEEGIEEIVYKPVPYIYHKLPADEDLYALFRSGASLRSRSISSVVNAFERPGFSQLRRRGINKAKRGNITVEVSDRLPEFWQILSANLLERHGVSPVHSLEEITRLSSLFPDEIKLYAAFREGMMVAGVLAYVTPVCFHSQYISASPEGKQTGALDLLFSVIMDNALSSRRYFDFGISTENGGEILNSGLIRQKEGFGGRGVCYDSYLWKLR